MVSKFFALVMPASLAVAQFRDRLYYLEGLPLIFESEAEAIAFLASHLEYRQAEVAPVLMGMAPLLPSTISQRPWREDRSTGRLRIVADDDRQTVVCEMSGSILNEASNADARLICNLVNGVK